MKIIVFLLSFYSALLLISCQNALEKPKQLLSEKEMTSILTDIYLYKQPINDTPLSNATAFNTYVSIFKAHNTTKEIFQNSYTFYYTDANTLQHIYDNVIDNLKGKLTKEQQSKIKQEEEERIKQEEEKKEKEKKKKKK